MRRVASFLVSCGIAGLAGMAASAAMAQSAAAPTTVAPVTVQAAAKPKVIEKQAHSFVQGHAAVPNPEVGQIGRWRDPVCVDVVGLPSPQDAATIKTRIESVAQALGLPAARARCTANVEIVFSDQPQRVMNLVAERREYMLGYHHVHDHERLKAVTRPIQSWYVTASQGNGFGVGPLLFSEVPISIQNRTKVIDDPDNAPPVGCANSRISSSCLQSEFANVFIVADSKALNGKDAGLVADYMVMLALSQPRSLAGCEALPSVIDLFANAPCAGRDTPDGLTAADAAYLTALYATDLEAKKAVEQSDIAGRMARILIRAAAPGR